VEDGPAWPSVRFDLLGIVDYLFPRGLDPFHGFRRPAFAVPLYQRIVRALSGYGAPPTEPFPTQPPVRKTANVVIVGAGKSGRAVARRLVELGEAPLVVDRELGGEDPQGFEGIRGVSVTVLNPSNPASGAPFELLGFTEDGRGFEARTSSVVLATGGYDASLLFGGNDRPGVLTADGALSLSPAQERSWFRRAVLVGSGRRAAEVLARFGHRIGAIVALGEIPPSTVRAASDLDIPLYPRSLLLGTRGRRRVTGVDLVARGRGPRFSLACDAVILAHRRLPNAQLLFLAGAQMAWHGSTGAYYPVLDADGRTSVPGLYAVGEAAGFLDESHEASGSAVAETVVGRPGSALEGLPRVPRAGPSELEGYYRELLGRRRRGRWVACRCEDVLLQDVDRATGAGYRGIEVVKRYSSLGAGLCQGRYCLPDALIVLALREGRTPPEVGLIRQRPPVFPTPLGTLASIDPALPMEAA
jgi:sarcosine oxidase, subunit alpha